MSFWVKNYGLRTPESAEKSPGRFERLLRGEVLRDEATHRRKDGSVYPLEISDRLFVRSGHKYIVAIHRDITERKRLEDACAERRCSRVHAREYFRWHCGVRRRWHTCSVNKTSREWHGLDPIAIRKKNGRNTTISIALTVSLR